MTAYDEYIATVQTVQNAKPTWRSGQTHFNVFAYMFPHLDDDIRGAELDPFYDDAKVPAFLDWLKARINTETV